MASRNTDHEFNKILTGRESDLETEINSEFYDSDPDLPKIIQMIEIHGVDVDFAQIHFNLIGQQD